LLLFSKILDSERNDITQFQIDRRLHTYTHPRGVPVAIISPG
jgi:hypothetical protein